jgi:predicted enzyme related to lactoylglutathione lyase
MAKITGLGGFFFRTSDPEATAKWFTDMLDLPTESWGRPFPWREGEPAEGQGYTIMGLHKASSDYFEPSKREFMINLRVDDLDGVLADLRARGVEIIKVLDPDPFGRFAHVMGPDGIKLELWQPPPEEPAAP